MFILISFIYLFAFNKCRKNFKNKIASATFQRVFHSNVHFYERALCCSGRGDLGAGKCCNYSVQLQARSRNTNTMTRFFYWSNYVVREGVMYFIISRQFRSHSLPPFKRYFMFWKWWFVEMFCSFWCDNKT